MESDSPRRNWLNCGATIAVVATMATGFAPRHAAAGAKWESATQAYQEICAYCHDTGVGPSLRKGAYTASHVQHVVRHGFNAMPAFLRADIDDQTLGQLADLIAKDKLP